MREGKEMNDLLDKVLTAHGGIERWKALERVTVTAVSTGGLFALKGMPQEPTPREQTVTLHEETASVFPFGNPDWRTRFTPQRVAIETTAGVLVRERADPRISFDGHDLLTPWDPLHRAYFNGYAMWTYLTTPFFMTLPGFEVAEIDPWQESEERWRGLRVRFPDTIASHSKEQDFYFGEDFLLRRHDYHVDIAGGFPAAQEVGDFVVVDGIRLPTKRRAYMRAPDLKPIRDLLMVAIDFTNVRFKRRDAS
jgi:hypothetical protein